MNISKEVVVKNLGLFGCMVVIAVIITPVHALVIRRDQSVEIPATEVIDDDLIAFGNTVDIKGTVTGNVCAFAQTVNVSGDIGGLLFIGAANANINAKNVQTVWAMGGNVDIAANVARNLILLGGSLSVNADAQTGKDLRAYGGNLTVNGVVNGTIKGGVGTFLLAGKSGSIEIKADKTRIKSTAVISGDFHLTSKSKPEIDEGATIRGEMSVREIEPEEAKPFFLAFAPLLAFLAAMIKIIVLISKIIVGILLIALFQKYVRRVMDTLTKQTWKSLGWGFLGVIVVPVAAVVLFVTLIGYPLGVLALFAYSILLYISSIFIGVVVGEKVIQLFRKGGGVSLYFSFIIGMLILFVVSFIPILNFLIRIFVILFGFGATMLATWQLVKDMRKKELV
jgi:hypothetical protein